MLVAAFVRRKLRLEPWRLLLAQEPRLFGRVSEGKMTIRPRSSRLLLKRCPGHKPFHYVPDDFLNCPTF